MVIEQLSALKLISDLVVSVVDSAQKRKGTPKQQLARKIVNMFDFFENLETQAANIIQELKTFENEPTIGMRVHYIHMCSISLDKFCYACRDFSDWYDKERQPSTVLELYAPNVSKTLIDLKSNKYLGMYHEKDVWFMDLQENFSAFKQALQAVKSPDPNLFPDAPFVKEVISEMEMLIRQIRKAKAELRKFATKHIAMDDFF